MKKYPDNVAIKFSCMKSEHLKKNLEVLRSVVVFCDYTRISNFLTNLVND